MTHVNAVLADLKIISIEYETKGQTLIYRRSNYIVVSRSPVSRSGYVCYGNLTGEFVAAVTVTPVRLT